MTLEPTQVLCVGRNYAAHAAELGHTVQDGAPLLFWKPASARCRDGVARLPRWPEGTTRIDFEGELALVLGRAIGPAAPPPDDPWDAVEAVACALDLSDRDLQKKEPQWVRAKGFADALGLGPYAPRPEDPTDLRLRTWHNGAQVQDGHTSLLLFPLRALLRYVASFCRLGAGDVILTGTPAGVGPIAPGDALRVGLSVGRDDDAPLHATLELRIEEGPLVPSFPRS